ncbi:integral membrane protein [Colletotrichum acutatum]
MSEVSVIPAPPGVTVDFDHPRQQKVLEHYLLFGVGGTIAFIALCQRFYTKLFLSKGLQVDDAPVFMLCNGFTKLSLLTFYLHLSPQKWFRVAVWTGIAVVSLYTACITILMLFHCNPVRKAFDFTITGGKCLDVGILYMATAVSNIITDVMLFILPMPMIFSLRMKMASKIGAVIIFAIGSILTYLPPLLVSVDPSWDAAPANIWTFVEANLFVICGSMPTLRKFFKHFAPKLMGSSTNPSSYAVGGYRMSYAHQRSTNAMKSRQRKQYEQFPDENEMHTFHSDRKRTNEEDPGFSSVVVAGGRESADDMSDKAILQTKTVTIQRD